MEQNAHHAHEACWEREHADYAALVWLIGGGTVIVVVACVVWAVLAALLTA